MDELDYPIERMSRRHDWREGVPVKLANGETWHLPVATVGPIEASGDGWAHVSMQVHGKDSREVTEAYYWPHGLSEQRGGPPPYPLSDHFRTMVGAALLRANYEITFPAAMVMLRHAFEMRGDVNAIAQVHAAIRRAFDSDGLAKIHAGIAHRADDN